MAILALATVLAGTATVVLAQSSGVPTVEELLLLSREERRAVLESLDPDDRLGLWMQVKQAEHGDSEPAEFPLVGFPLDVGGWKVDGKPRTKAVVGTITYDSGLPNVAFAPGAPSLPGNRFNTHTGLPVCNPGTVSTVQALVVPGPGAGSMASAGFVLLGPQTGGGAAMALFSTFGPATGLIDSVTFAGMGATYTGSEFFVLFGAFSSSFVPAFGPGTNLGQGHHGVIGNTGAMGPNITTTSAFGTPLNGFIRATGTIVPVELMTFEVD